MFASLKTPAGILGRGPGHSPVQGHRRVWIAGMACTLIGLSLSACGQKGPLFLPPPPRTVTAPLAPPPATPAPAPTPEAGALPDSRPPARP